MVPMPTSVAQGAKAAKWPLGSLIRVCPCCKFRVLYIAADIVDFRSITISGLCTMQLLVIFYPSAERTIEVQNGSRHHKEVEYGVGISPYIELASPPGDRFREAKGKETYASAISSTFRKPPRHTAPLPHDVPAVD